MKKICFSIILLSFCLPAIAQLNKAAATALIKRVIPQQAQHFEVAYIPKENGKDVFEIESVNHKIILRGNNGIAVASALNYYLKHYCFCDISWNGTNLKLPETLPVVKQKVHKVSPYKYRYYLNYCTFNYSMSWWDWKRWQWEIDWMAMHGINMPLAITGQAAVWQKVYEKMGLSKDDLKSFFSGPAYFAWFYMGNLDGWDGPLPQHWIDTHEALQRQILTQERALGMTPVLPAFSGHVPPALKDKFPEAKLKKTNWGAGFDDVYILDPSDPLFEKIGKDFIDAETAVYGTDHLYSADTFNENTPPSNDSSYLSAVSEKVYQSMQAADPEAVWVMQGWLFVNAASFWHQTQIKALLNAVPDDHMIILDLWSETNPVWNKTEAYYGKPWIWNMLQNFGGNVSLFGRMEHVAHDPAAALKNPQSGKMLGIGLTPEGIEQNPALFELMMENSWADKPIDLDQWLAGYEHRRYGKANADLVKAWEILKNTVYNGIKREGGPESIITGRPTFDSATTWTNTNIGYDPAALLPAWKLFIDNADSFRNNDGFQYDIVDLTRQVLANYATPLQQKFAAAYRQNDSNAFHKYSQQFLELIDDMDRLLATRKDFLLGKWLKEARSQGDTKAEKDLYELNARNLVTLWGDKNSPLHEYACKQWAGLLSGFYKPRWQQFFDYCNTQMAKGDTADVKAFDNRIKDWEEAWIHGHEDYTASPVGDPVAVAQALYKKYYQTIQNSY